MKRIILSSFLVLCSINVCDAQSLDALWKSADEAKAKDLPKTELAKLDDIISLSEKQKQYGHLLKASLRRINVITSVTPDSLKHEVSSLVNRELQLRGSDGLLDAVYCSVLGNIYKRNSTLSADADSLANFYFARSLSNPELLASHKIVNLSPLLEETKCSREHYGGDLLHVLANAAGDVSVQYDYYSRGDNRLAAMFTSFKKVKSNRRIGEKGREAYLSSLDSLLVLYGDLPWAGEIAYERYACLSGGKEFSAKDRYDALRENIVRWKDWPRVNRFKNDLTNLTRPRFHGSVGEQQVRTSERRVLKLSGIRNVPDLMFSLTRVNIDGREHDVNVNNEKSFDALKKKLEKKSFFSNVHKYDEPEWKEHADSVVLPYLPAGVYLLEVKSSNSAVENVRELLFVSDLYVMTEEWPDKWIHYVVVNATTGKPVVGAKLELTGNTYSCDSEGKHWKETLTTNANGEASIAIDDCKPNLVWAYTNDDKGFIKNNVYPFYNFHVDKSIYTDTHFFTDRALYRPGQTVHVVFFVNKRHPDNSTPTVEGRKAELQLLDANYKVVSRKEVVTDKYGTAYADFELPSNGLTGRYQIRATGLGSVSFNVEEYKRPTFFVEFENVEGAYKLGDTINVIGKATSYAGVPVQNAKVKYKAIARQATWWRYYNDKPLNEKVADGEAATDNDGKFMVRLPLVVSDEQANNKHQTGYHSARFYSFEINAEVTDVGGETHQGNTVVPIGTHPTILSCYLPSREEKDSLKQIYFSYRNVAGKEIDGEVTYWFDDSSRAYSAKANKAVDVTKLVGALSTGKHILHAICGNDTLKEEIILFSMNDKKPCIETHEWFYVPKTTFSKGEPLKVQIGSSDEDVYVYYSTMANNKLVDHGMFKLNNSIETKSFIYKDEYGDGLSLTYAWVKNGKFYTHSTMLVKPLPDKKLNVTWKTFRNRLEPGQKETWTAQVTTSDGKPADAQLMAVLYDKSLDQIKRHNWSMYLSMRRSLPSVNWCGLSYNNVRLNWYGSRSSLNVDGLYYTSFDSDLFSFYSSPKVYDTMVGKAKKREVMLESAPMAQAAGKVADAKAVAMFDKAEQTDNGNAVNDENTSDAETNDGVRENFAETGFFFPALHTDEHGEVVMQFTLPESLTTWRFMGLAHDVNTNYGMLRDEVVAKKKVMVQPNMPRFVRADDEATISARIINTSEQALEGYALLELKDAESGKIVEQQRVDYKLNINDTKAVTFKVQLSETTSLYICKITAHGNNYSDGEQHYLTVLPSKELVTNTYPFTLHEPQVKTIDLTKLFAVNDSTSKLTVEYTNNPSWLVVQALPTYASPVNDNAIDQATSYYVNMLGKYIMRSASHIREVIDVWRNETGDETSLESALEKNETLKNIILNETPWVLDADRESEQKRKLMKFFDEPTMDMRLESALKKMYELQLSNGAWTWWKQMPGSIYMTVSVATMLERLNHLLGNPNQEVQHMLDKAYQFIDHYLRDEYTEMRKAEKKGKKIWRPSQTIINVLYLNALSGRKLDKSTLKASEYMLNLMEKRTTEYTIYGKATAAFIFSRNNRAKKASEYLQSIEEYSVLTEEMGRYYDTHKAYYSWYSYQIPTQVAVIEAFKTIKPEQKQTIEELQRWLLQAKRTQSWSTPINSVNAIFAFLQDNIKTLDKQENATFKLNGEPLSISAASAGLGYVKTVSKGDEMKTLTIEKTSNGTSWGAVYAQFMQQTTEIETSEAQLSVKRELFLADSNGKLLSLSENNSLKVGDKVKVRITIKAERDYDFVQIADKRAACMEPIKQLSGYHWGYYISPRDNCTYYYFDKLAKGTHVVENEYYIDRVGVYQTGTCTVQCAYAPEYAARDKAIVLSVKE